MALIQLIAAKVSSFGSFAVDTPFGKFQIIVKGDKLMDMRDARADAMTVMEAEFGKAGVNRVSAEGKALSKLPAGADEVKKTQGWGWIIKTPRT